MATYSNQPPRRDEKDRGNYPSTTSSKSYEKTKYGEIEFSADWITTSITEQTIKFADGFGRELASRSYELTTSQIRNVFGEIKRIQMAGFAEQRQRTDFLLLKPKMAYAAKRAKSDGALAFEYIMRKAHEAVRADDENNDKRFENFCDFVEAILAYHKFYGGKEN